MEATWVEKEAGRQLKAAFEVLNAQSMLDDHQT